MAKLFITGIGGFIGRHIAAQALEEGYEVFGSDMTAKEIEGVNVSKADIRDKEAMLRLTKGMDYVIHLAAVTSNVEFEARMPYCFDVNVSGFNSVIEAAYTNKCKRFLYASSSAVYNDEFSEDSIINIREMTNYYARTKLINEAVAKSYRSKKLLDTVGMRFFNVYGPGENNKGNYASIIALYKRYKQANEPIVIYNDGSQTRDLIYAPDAAKIVVRLITKAKRDIYNVGTGKSTSYNEIANMIDKGKKVYVKSPLTSYQILTRADTSNLLKDIGPFKFTSVEEGIRSLS
jgi:nucleoside-diphosphate-sugar epimerase